MYVLSPRSVVVLQEHGAVDIVLRASLGRDDAEALAGAGLVQLQATYEKLSKEKDETKEKINDDDFKFAKAVKKAAAKASTTDEL